MAESTAESAATTILDAAKTGIVRVLHVDDDPTFLRVAKDCLEMQGEIDVRTATSVREALEMLEKTDYAAIVSDYQMPDKNGLEFLKELREKGNAVPFIIFTGKGREEVAVRALNLGADQYIDKSGSPDTVYGELAHAIRYAVSRKLAHTESLKREVKLNAILESSPEAITVTDLNGVMLECNQATLDLIACISKSEVVGRNALHFVSEKDRKRVLDNMKRVLKQGSLKNIEYTLRTKDDREFPAEISVSLLRDSSGNAVGFVDITKDVTERNKVEDALRKSENKYRTLLENLPQRVFFKDINSVYVSCNENYARDLKIRPDEIAGKTDYDFYPKELAEKYRADDKKNIESGKTQDIEEAYIENGQERIVHTAKTPVKDENGNIIGVLGIFWDVTERRLMEQKYAIVIDTALDGFWINDSKGQLIAVNDAYCEMIGYTREELLSMSIQDIEASEKSEDTAEHLSKILKEGHDRFETRHRRKDGSVIDVEISTNRYPVGDGQLVVFVRDITERKRVEEALRRAEGQARLLLEFQNKIIDTATVWIDILDMEGNVTLWNRAAELISGYSREEVIGNKKIWEWLYPDPKDLAKAFSHAEEVMHSGGRSEGFESTMRCKDGTFKTISWYDNSILDENGKPVSYIAVGIDITERKTAEKSIQESQEKLRVAGSLTRHDVRNKLSTVTGNAYLLKRKLAGDAKALERLSDIQKAIQQVERIFDFAKTYERLGVEQLTHTDVGEAVDEALSLFSDLKGVKIANECRGLTVLADSLLRQLFYNLIDNSLKYGEKIKTIKVYYKKPGEDQLELVYEDDGVGIPDDMRSSLFKEGAGKGTGYGLFMIKRMCEVYGWTIHEAGEHGRGVRFIMTIPKLSKLCTENKRILAFQKKRRPPPHRDKASYSNSS